MGIPRDAIHARRLPRLNFTLRPLYHRWSNRDTSILGPLKTARYAPHIKTFVQPGNGDEINWMVLTSHNLSKPSLGEFQTDSKTKERQLMIQHWELVGILVSFSANELFSKPFIHLTGCFLFSGNAVEVDFRQFTVADDPLRGSWTVRHQGCRPRSTPLQPAPLQVRRERESMGH